MDVDKSIADYINQLKARSENAGPTGPSVSRRRKKNVRRNARCGTLNDYTVDLLPYSSPTHGSTYFGMTVVEGMNNFAKILAAWHESADAPFHTSASGLNVVPTLPFIMDGLSITGLAELEANYPSWVAGSYFIWVEKPAGSWIATMATTYGFLQVGVAETSTGVALVMYTGGYNYYDDPANPTLPVTTVNLPCRY